MGEHFSVYFKAQRKDALVQFSDQEIAATLSVFGKVSFASLDDSNERDELIWCRVQVTGVQRPFPGINNYYAFVRFQTRAVQVFASSDLRERER